MELWLLGTAIVFTFVGYYMGKQTGMENGIDGTLTMLNESGYIKITKLANGEISIDKAGE
jgi:hypothetical protein